MQGKTEINLRLFKYISIVLIIVISCNETITPPENDENYIRLQNQSDHSGVLIKLLNTDVMTVTDSLGNFTLPKTADGEYTLQAKFPFFEIYEENVQVKNAFLQTKIQAELKQQLQFWVEPAETTISLAEKTRFWNYNAYVKNLSDEKYSTTEYAYTKNWGIVPQSFNWRVNNDSINSDYCYEIYTYIGLTDIPGIGGFTIEADDTLSYKYYDICPLGYDCTPPGKSYLLYYIAVDTKKFEEFYNSEYPDGIKQNTAQSITPLFSLLKKKELFRPAIIHFTE